MARNHHATPEALYEALVHHAETLDVDALHQLWEDEPSFIPAPGKVAKGSRALRERLIGWTGMRPTMVVFRIAERLESGDLSLCFTPWEFTANGENGKPQVLRGVATDVVRRSDHGWRFVLDNPFGTVAFEQR